MGKEKNIEIMKYFAEVKLIEEYEPYFCSVEDAITIVIVGTFCGFQNLKQIHGWADHEKIREQLLEYFGVKHVPCYYWLTCLLKIMDPKSMSQCFTRWVNSLLPEDLSGYTISFDGKTVCSTGSMERYENPLHIVSAQIAELGLTFGQEAVEGKSNEIPATQRLIKMLNLKGTIVVADALNCQKNTAEAIIDQGVDYLLCVKDNQSNLKHDIEDFVQDPPLRAMMETSTTKEKNRERIEKRTAYVTHDIAWLENKNDWASMACIGAINTKFTSKTRNSDEWHYYISSKQLSADELLKHARAEWSVESMHWLLDVHFKEDDCRVQDKNVQQVLNIVRKIVINSMRVFRDKTNSKRPFSNIMIDCLIDLTLILNIVNCQNPQY
jgi:predicted transposase YbfD/YdcC